MTKAFFFLVIAVLLVGGLALFVKRTSDRQLVSSQLDVDAKSVVSKDVSSNPDNFSDMGGPFTYSEPQPGDPTAVVEGMSGHGSMNYSY